MRATINEYKCKNVNTHINAYKRPQHGTPLAYGSTTHDRNFRKNGKIQSKANKCGGGGGGAQQTLSQA